MMAAPDAALLLSPVNGAGCGEIVPREIESPRGMNGRDGDVTVDLSPQPVAVARGNGVHTPRLTQP